MTFLREIAAQLKSEFGPEISDLCLVVPTRRAVAFLREAIAQTYRQTLWAPQIISIQDLVRGLSGWQFPETLPLVFELYQVYKTIMRQQQPNWDEPFERFYAWGEMLVKDFDEIDKYLVDTQQLFTNIKDLKEIDLFFTLEPENLVPIRRFWETLRGKKEDLTEVQQEFLRIWQMLLDIYTGYKAQLAAKYQAYDGMAYRYLVQQLEEEKLAWPHKQTIFIGFNALSTAEERIMHFLLKEKKAIVYWDVDYVYFTPTKHESPEDDTALRDEGHLAGEEPGKFIDEYHYKWRDLDSRLILHNMRAHDKHIHITGVPLQVGQAQYLGNLMQDIQTDQTLPRDHALVLADEQMLFSTLYALPSHMEELNITMGFPLKQTHLHHLILTTLRLLQNMRFDSQGQRVFSHREVTQLINNPYIKGRFHELSEKLQQEIRAQNLVFVSQKFLKQHELSPLLAHIFDPPLIPPTLIQDLLPLMRYVEGVFDEIQQEAFDRKDQWESELAFHLHKYFTQLKEILLLYKPELSLRGFLNLVREVLQKVRVPFEGEPLTGYQLMGFLETRVLDFKKVFILGANEGNLPDTSSGNSFVPYSLRKGFGLPTYEEKDAIYAYHFYRLLQRTDEIHLIYNTVVDEQGGSKEVSRFIRQIRHFFRNTPEIHIHDSVVTIPVPYSETPGISIPPSPATHEKLLKRYVHPTAAPKPTYLSATAMTTYLGCKLKFYYRYIAGIREPETIEENIEANTLGSVLHYTLELLYQDHLNKVVTPELTKELKANIGHKLKAAFDAHDLPWGSELRGMNFLLREVIEQQVGRILSQDRQGEVFQVISIEDENRFFTTLDVEGLPVRINGMLDRVDFLPNDNVVRIIDYKTGYVDLPEHVTLDKCFESDKHKEVFQGYLYAWLFQRQQPDASIKVGYYTVRELSKGVKYIEKGKVIPNQVLVEYEKRLKELIHEMLTGDYPQTEDESHCRYCPYNTLCNRIVR
ncbi:MAG: PD-(D/E)XK nuclease family protein [Bacteroidota bacterium]